MDVKRYRMSSSNSTTCDKKGEDAMTNLIHMEYAHADERIADGIRNHLAANGHAMGEGLDMVYVGIMTGRFIQERKHLSIPRKLPVVLVYPRELKLPVSLQKRLSLAKSVRMDRFESNKEFYDALDKLLFDASDNPRPCLDEEVKELVLPEGIQRIHDLSYDGMKGIEKVKLPESLQSIGYRVFAKCENIQEIEIPENVVEIEDAAFLGCTSLASVIFHNKLKVIGRSAFTGCKSLQGVILPGIQVIKPYAFSECTSLGSVVLGNEIQVIGDGAFSDCERLESFRISQDA